MSANATREGVQKNSLNISREAVKKFPEHQDLILKFLRSFEARHGEPDGRFGNRKYKGLLRSAANHHMETIHIDLNDVEEFCSKELAEPDDQISQALSISPVQLQESIQTLIKCIETNALRYMNFFYKACVAEKPERDADFNKASHAVAKDNIHQWRQRLLAQRDGAVDGVPGAAPIPVQLENNFDVRFKPRHGSESSKLREIGAANVGHLVLMDCMIVRVSAVKPKIEVVTYHCELCQAEIFQVVEGERFTPPKECPSQKCRENKQSGKLNCNLRTCKFNKYQEVRVQEMSEHVPVGGVPRTMNVVLLNDLTRTVLPGDAVQITGVYVPYQMPWFMQRSKGTCQEMYIEAHSVKKHKSGYNEKAVNEGEIARQIDEEVSKGDVFERCAKSIAPEIFGMVNEKKALLIVLVGANTKVQEDGMKIRGDIHTLFMGDPGVAKSQLLKQVCNIAPRSVYTTGKGSSGVGLTASVVRDNTTGEVSLEGGALVLADMGICCIDEFDKMEVNDRTAIHEVMEQQTVSIAKSGITTTLNARTTVLAAANPVFGRYNPYKSPVENMDLPPSLLSRFDLLFLLLDTVDQDKDRHLAMHVCKVHSIAPDGRVEERPILAAGAASETDSLDLGFKPLNAAFLRVFVKKARTFDPLISEPMTKEIVDAYVQMREDEKKEGHDNRKAYTTPRSLLAIVRISQALARIRFSNLVEREDFDEAMRITKASKESVELAAPVKKDVNPLDIVYDIVADQSRRSVADGQEGWVQLAHIVSTAGHKALTQEMVVEAIQNWEDLSVMCQNPDKSMVRFMVPQA